MVVFHVDKGLAAIVYNTTSKKVKVIFSERKRGGNPFLYA